MKGLFLGFSLLLFSSVGFSQVTEITSKLISEQAYEAGVETIEGVVTNIYCMDKERACLESTDLYAFGFKVDNSAENKTENRALEFCVGVNTAGSREYGMAQLGVKSANSAEVVNVMHQALKENRKLKVKVYDNGWLMSGKCILEVVE